jgi:acyl-CoA oxidase
MVGDSANSAKKALTIAVRYAAIRRQFSSGKGKVRQLQSLDSCEAEQPARNPDLGLPDPSATSNGKLTPVLGHEANCQPLLAQSIAMGFTGLKLQTMYEVSSHISGSGW